MGKVPKVKMLRNQEIVRRFFKNKEKQADLAKEYNVSRERIRQIIAKWKFKYQ